MGVFSSKTELSETFGHQKSILSSSTSLPIHFSIFSIWMNCSSKSTCFPSQIAAQESWRGCMHRVNLGRCGQWHSDIPSDSRFFFSSSRSLSRSAFSRSAFCIICFSFLIFSLFEKQQRLSICLVSHDLALPLQKTNPINLNSNPFHIHLKNIQTSSSRFLRATASCSFIYKDSNSEKQLFWVERERERERED